MDSTKAQQMALDEALVATTNRLNIGKGNQRLSPNLKSNEATIQVVLDALKLTPVYNAFLVTASVPEIYMQEFWVTVTLHHTSLRFKLNAKSHTLNMENFRDMLNIYPRLQRERFQDPPVDEEILSFHSDLGHSGEIRVSTNVNTSQDMLESKAYKEYYAFASGAVPPKAKTAYKKKAKEPVSSKTASESASKCPRLKTQAKMKQPTKKTKAKGLTMLIEAALSEADQLKLATKRSKKDFHISYASGSGDGVGKLSKVLDEQEQEDTSTDEGTDTLSGVPDVPKYESESDMESWGDSEEEGNDDDDGNNDDEGSNDDESDDEKTEFENDDDGQQINRKSRHSDDFYNALVASYNSDKDIISSYGDVVLLKRGNNDKDKYQDPSVGSDRGMKRQRTGKDADSSKDQRSKEKRSTSSSKEASKSQHTSSGKSVHSEEPSHNVEDTSKHQHQEYVMWETDEQPDDNEATKANWFKKPERPPTPDSDWSDVRSTSNHLRLGSAKLLELKNLLLHSMSLMPLRTCKSLIELEYHLEECSKATAEKLDWNNPENKPYPFNLRKLLSLIQDHRGCQIIPKDYFINKDLEYLNGVKYDQYALYGISHWGPKCQSFYCYASNLTSPKDVYSRRRIIAFTRLKIKRKYDYGYLEEIEVRRDDQQIYTFEEGYFSRLCLQDIEDMLILLTQQRLTNLTVDEQYDLNVVVRMYTRRIVIQRRVKDIQLGVKSYQKKLNLTKPDTYGSHLRDRTAYTSHSNPHGIIYLDQSKRKRLMRTDELHKFSDGTLNDVRTSLHDIDAGLRMEYLPMRKWSQLDRKRVRVMV
nr:hypothetical protein [Tanacetum cinerariifolium]